MLVTRPVGTALRDVGKIDQDRLLAFLGHHHQTTRTCLRLATDRLPENYYLLKDQRNESVSGAIMRAGSVPGLVNQGIGASSVIYLEVTDLEATASAALAAGGRSSRRTGRSAAMPAPSRSSLPREPLPWACGAHDWQSGCAVDTWSAVEERRRRPTHPSAPFLYLLLGHDRAILFDTGATKDSESFPLRETIDQIIDSWIAANPGNGNSYELIVAHTRSHGDHIISGMGRGNIARLGLRLRCLPGTISRS